MAIAPKSASQLRRAHPNKYSFQFMVVSPNDEATLYEGVFGAKTDDEMHDLASAFMDWIHAHKGKRTSGKRILSPKLPPGVVEIHKPSTGEEGE